MRPTRVVWLSLIIPALLSTGCVRLHGPEDIRRDLSRSAGVRLNRETGITVTRSGVWLARKILKWTHADEEMPVSLKGLRRVQVGVYEVEGLRRGFETPAPIDLREHFDPTWTPIVRVQENDESVLVLTRAGERPGQVRAMLVVVAEEDEWVLVRLRGKLEHIVEDAMQFAFEEADRPDLYAKARQNRDIPLLPSETQPGLGPWVSICGY